MRSHTMVILTILNFLSCLLTLNFEPKLEKIQIMANKIYNILRGINN